MTNYILILLCYAYIYIYTTIIIILLFNVGIPYLGECNANAVYPGPVVYLKKKKGI